MATKSATAVSWEFAMIRRPWRRALALAVTLVIPLALIASSASAADGDILLTPPSTEILADGTPPTCTDDGVPPTIPDLPHMTWQVNPEFDGPGEYVLTWFPDAGYTFGADPDNVGGWGLEPDGGALSGAFVVEPAIDPCPTEPSHADVGIDFNRATACGQTDSVFIQYFEGGQSTLVGATFPGFDQTPGTHTVVFTVIDGYLFAPNGDDPDQVGVVSEDRKTFAFTYTLNQQPPCPPTTTIIPVPSQFAAAPTAPTCEQAGALPTFGTVPNVAWKITPSFHGPGAYVLTVTPNVGYAFELGNLPAGWGVEPGGTEISRTLVVTDAIGFQSVDPSAPCYSPSFRVYPATPVADDQCGTANDRYVLPANTESIAYRYDRAGHVIATIIAPLTTWGTLPPNWLDNGLETATYVGQSSDFTDVACGPIVIPVKPFLSAAPTPPTCDTDGTMPNFDAAQPEHFTTQIAPTFNGPGGYVLTVTPKPGYAFDANNLPAGWGYEPQSGAISRALTVGAATHVTQSTDPQAPCFQAASPAPTPSASVPVSPSPAPTTTSAAITPPATDAGLTAANRGTVSATGSFVPGGTVTVNVGTQYAGQTEYAFVYSTPTALGAHVVSSAGTFTVVLPTTLPAGTHTIAVLDSTGTVIGWVQIAVSDPAALATTGSEAGDVFLLAVLVTALGAFLILEQRRRPRLVRAAHARR